MNKFRVILSIVLVCGLATQTAICADEDRSGLINKAQRRYRTFKTDMSCLFNRKKKCTPEQKKRIAAQALAVTLIVTALAALTGTGFLFGTKRGKGLKIKWRLTPEQKEDRDAMISFLDVYIPFFEANKYAIIQNDVKNQKDFEAAQQQKTQLAMEVLSSSPLQLQESVKRQVGSKFWNLKEERKQLQIGAENPLYYDHKKKEMFEEAKKLIGDDLLEQLKEKLPENLKEQFQQ